VLFDAQFPASQGGYRGCGHDQLLALVSDAKLAGFARRRSGAASATLSRKRGKARRWLNFRPVQTLLHAAATAAPPPPPGSP